MAFVNFELFVVNISTFDLRLLLKRIPQADGTVDDEGVRCGIRVDTEVSGALKLELVPCLGIREGGFPESGDHLE
mgnify:CR=1 FL=1